MGRRVRRRESGTKRALRIDIGLGGGVWGMGVISDEMAQLTSGRVEWEYTSP